MATIPEMLTAALQLQQARRWQEAENAYRAILQIDPQQADALHLLGLVYHETNRPNLALDCMHRAVRAKPNFAQAYFNLGVLCQKYGKLAEAAASYQQAIGCKPDYAEAH